MKQTENNMTDQKCVEYLYKKLRQHEEVIKAARTIIDETLRIHQILGKLDESTLSNLSRCKTLFSEYLET